MGFKSLPRRAVFVALALFTAGTAPATFAADYVSQKGTWILNKKESKIPPNSFTPIDTPTVVSLDDGTAIKLITYVMTGTGLEPGPTFDGHYDGKPYPFGKDATRTLLHVSPNSFRDDLKMNDGSSSTEVVTFTAGNAKMRAEGKYTDAKGKVSDYVQVWDKVQ